ncbi:MAG: response regulator transcription factor [Candidatus Zixiibacteriota bacterium]|nr:MAG: response regulator transcription factor [candidate division Zixibacteria bacterium]
MTKQAIRVLLLEDDANLGLVLQEHLQMQGFEVTLCVNGVEGLEAYSRDRFDLCLVDVMMPKKDGFSFAREVRARDAEIPLIFLTAKSLKEDKVEGFRIGCDDYITKPFSVEELLLRISAVLRRAGTADDRIGPPTMFEIGSYTFDYTRQLLVREGHEVRLTSREAELLNLLCRHMNRTLERDQALREVWADESYFSGRSMDVFISKLRKYLKEDERIEILSVRGRGFRLVVGS